MSLISTTSQVNLKATAQTSPSFQKRASPEPPHSPTLPTTAQQTANQPRSPSLLLKKSSLNRQRHLSQRKLQSQPKPHRQTQRKHQPLQLQLRQQILPKLQTQ